MVYAVTFVWHYMLWCSGLKCQYVIYICRKWNMYVVFIRKNCVLTFHIDIIFWYMDITFTIFMRHIAGLIIYLLMCISFNCKYLTSHINIFIMLATVYLITLSPINIFAFQIDEQMHCRLKRQRTFRKIGCGLSFNFLSIYSATMCKMSWTHYGIVQSYCRMPS